MNDAHEKSPRPGNVIKLSIVPTSFVEKPKDSASVVIEITDHGKVSLSTKGVKPAHVGLIMRAMDDLVLELDQFYNDALQDEIAQRR